MRKKVLCSAEKSFVIWAEPHSRSSTKQSGRTYRSAGHYYEYLELILVLSLSANKKRPVEKGL